MTTDKYRPKVLIIRTPGHELSQEYSEITRKSWEKYGYETEFFDATTPEDLKTGEHTMVKLSKRKSLIRRATKKIMEQGMQEGFTYYPIFSETEEAVFYSHLYAWKLIIERNEPMIIVEHDGKLQHDDWDCEHHDYYVMAMNPLGAGYYTPHILKRFFQRMMPNGVLRANVNIDGVWHAFVENYLAGQLGPKIRTKTHMIDRKDWHTHNWEVDTFWAKGTIKHREHYDSRISD